MMVVSGSMMLPVSQAPSICIGGASSGHHKKFENLLSTSGASFVVLSICICSHYHTFWSFRFQYIFN